MLAATIPADAPDSDTTVWYATGLGWWQAEGGTLASGRISGDPDGHGTPSTGAEEQVRLSPPPAKNKNSEPPLSSADFGSFPTDFRGLTGFLCGAQGALEPSLATPIAARAQERAESVPRTFGDLIREHLAKPIAYSRLRRLDERISWLELELRTLKQERDALQRGH